MQEAIAASKALTFGLVEIEPEAIYKAAFFLNGSVVRVEAPKSLLLEECVAKGYNGNGSLTIKYKRPEESLKIKTKPR